MAGAGTAEHRSEFYASIGSPVPKPPLSPADHAVPAKAPRPGLF